MDDNRHKDRGYKKLKCRLKMKDRVTSGVAIIRLLVGWVFLVEGILKFILPDEMGVGRFTSIGIPAPHVMGPFVGALEIFCGALVLAGFFTRFVAIVLLIDISVAIISTKIPIWLGHGYWRFTLPKLKHYGFLSMLHEARTDFSILLGLIFLLILGAGAWSVDAKLWQALRHVRRPTPLRDFARPARDHGFRLLLLVSNQYNLADSGWSHSRLVRSKRTWVTHHDGLEDWEPLGEPNENVFGVKTTLSENGRRDRWSDSSTRPRDLWSDRSDNITRPVFRCSR